MATIDLSTLSANLRRLRTAQKLSQGELADQAGLSREGYRRIEEGAVEPRVDSLMRVAAVLDVRTDELLAPSRQLKAVRFRAQKRMTTREDLLATVARWLDDYAELEDIVEDKPDFRLAPLAQSLQSRAGRSDPMLAARVAREDLGIKDGELIRDVCGLLEDNGIKVYTPSIASDGFFGLSVAREDGGPAVVVNCWDRISVERWIFTAIHELGHLLLHLDAYDVTKTEEDEGQETEANLFASHFLMPDHLFEQEWREARGLALVDRVFKMKRIFRVSWKTVVYRIAAQSSEPSKVWSQFYSAYKRSAGKSLKGTEEPDGLAADAFSSQAAAPAARLAEEPAHLLPSDFVEDRLLRLVRKGVEDGLVSMSRAAEILDIDLKSMRAIAGSWME